MTALTKTEINNNARNAVAIKDLQMLGGIVARGAWQTGTGNFKKARAVPAGAAEFTNCDSKAPLHVLSWFAQHPRAQRCVAIV
jgi:hypothetical protein